MVVCRYAFKRILGYDHMACFIAVFIDEMASIVAPIAEHHNVTAVHLFGSRSTGRNDHDGDYDFILDTTDDFSFSDYCGFIDELSVALGRPVDVVDRSCLSDDGFSRRVRREEVHIWG